LLGIKFMKAAVSKKKPYELSSSTLDEEEFNRMLVNESIDGADATSFFNVASESSFTANRLASFLHTSLKTFQRYLKDQKKLDPAASEHLLRLKSAYSLGKEVFGSTASFEQWLDAPAPAFDGALPSRFMSTPGGVQLIHQELIRMGLGYPV
jgi:putative toxin-antitoxin system antitoxin component (TIGR02293 family)